METTILILVLTLAVGAFVFLRLRRRPAIKDSPPLSEYRRFDGLFAEQYAAESKLIADAEAKVRDEEERQGLLRRATEGDETALDDAHEKGDEKLYRNVLQTLVAQAEGNSEDLRSIAEYIVDSGQLRTSSEFADAMIEIWRKSSKERTLVDMLQLAALSDTAETFQRAVEVAFKNWSARKPPQVSAGDFLAAVESAYWLIAAEVRYSGSGFMIKRAIAELRRELAAATGNRQPTTDNRLPTHPPIRQ